MTTTQTTAPATRRVNVSSSKVANQGALYTDTLLGLVCLEVTDSGAPFVGTVTAFMQDYPVLTAPDGSWMRARSTRLDVLR